jgi:hypothetical protein
MSSDQIIKAIERAGEFDEDSFFEWIESREDKSVRLSEAAKHQHAQDQWLRDVARIAVEALERLRDDDDAEDALAEIAALIPGGEDEP